MALRDLTARPLLCRGTPLHSAALPHFGLRLPVLDPWPFVSAAAQRVGRLRDLLPGTEVLVLTSVAHAAMGSRGRLSGAVRVLEKPCPPVEPLATVARLLEAEEPLTPGVDA